MSCDCKYQLPNEHIILSVIKCSPCINLDDANLFSFWKVVRFLLSGVEVGLESSKN